MKDFFAPKAIQMPDNKLATGKTLILLVEELAIHEQKTTWPN